MTWKRVRSNAPSWKSPDVGYWNVPGPWSSPDGSVTSRPDVPGSDSDVTDTRAYPVAEPFDTPTVITLAPNPSGTVAENEPSPAAVVVVRVVAPPVSVGVEAIVTVAPAAVVPVTCVVASLVSRPFAGVVIVTVSAAGGAWST